MERCFNVAGMCREGEHYMLPPLRRVPAIRELVDRKAYFILHAPRQVGESTSLQAVARALTREGRYAAILLSMETGAPRTDQVQVAEDAILADWRADIRDQWPAELHPPPWPDAPPQWRIAGALEFWAQRCPRPLVVFLDEIDSLRDAVLVSVLRQLRSGYRRRPRHFPWSLALCGMRDVRDYQLDPQDMGRSHSASPFNVKDGSLTLRNFSREEVAELYQQHTEDTGQRFTAEAVALAYEQTEGQPWLVNALAKQATEAGVLDRRSPVGAEHIEAAREALLQRRDTHLDSLAERLHEPRVRRIIEPILVGEHPPMDVMNDDLLYARDLGLIVDRPQVRIANPIYQELIPRALTQVVQGFLSQESAWYRRPDGSLDMVLLLASFQEFFAEQSESWLKRYDYQEAGPHLLLMAFLQRVVNGGGRIRREFAVGSGRADLVLEYGGRRAVVELKLRRNAETVREGLVQLSGYLDRLGEAEGYLVIFDRRKRVSWADKIFIEEAAGPRGQRVFVFGV